MWIRNDGLSSAFPMARKLRMLLHDVFHIGQPYPKTDPMSKAQIGGNRILTETIARRMKSCGFAATIHSGRTIPDRLMDFRTTDPATPIVQRQGSFTKGITR
jgi:hypothetical protein